MSKSLVKYLYRVICLAFLYLSYPSHAQQKTFDTQVHTWWSNKTIVELNKNWSILNELHFRRSNVIMDWQQFIVRPSIHYSTKMNLNPGLGYTYVLNFPYLENSKPINVPEHNVWQELVWVLGKKKFQFSQRLRIEERFIGMPTEIADNEFVITDYNFSQRLRYKFGVSIQMKKHEKLFLKTFDEVFFDFGNNSSPAGISQNRVYVGMSWKFIDKCRLAFGVLDQLIIRNPGNLYENNITTEVSLICKIGHKKE
ncbi:DUF2490 domain-containing protein [Paracrocinitomix mangrovi]|uniref:DUF2490 domain-containing protein n=1 Tax=Paracrocinitomix mangrovi TaxID=2862509 RepID=UPI001C8EF2A0|nr:DUF2490 domain-containing protein [Paracrocinitomix mangrovi]UKN00656.1 DUF2490 domain-containing protein [Paracrocinitomix mangrovi]